MTTQDSSYAPLSSTGRRPAGGAVDFTVMYAAHDAFQRDLDRLTAAARAARTTDPAVRAGAGPPADPPAAERRTP
jgi:hypothetical protein